MALKAGRKRTLKKQEGKENLTAPACENFACSRHRLTSMKIAFKINCWKMKGKLKAFEIFENQRKHAVTTLQSRFVDLYRQKQKQWSYACGNVQGPLQIADLPLLSYLRFASERPKHVEWNLFFKLRGWTADMVIDVFQQCQHFCRPLARACTRKTLRDFAHSQGLPLLDRYCFGVVSRRMLPAARKVIQKTTNTLKLGFPKWAKHLRDRTQLVVLKERSWKDALFNMPAVSKYFQLASLENISQEEVQFSPRP